MFYDANVPQWVIVIIILGDAKSNTTTNMHDPDKGGEGVSSDKFPNNQRFQIKEYNFYW